MAALEPDRRDRRCGQSAAAHRPGVVRWVQDEVIGEREQPVGQRDVFLDEVDVRLDDCELRLRQAAEHVRGARSLVIEQLAKEHLDLRGCNWDLTNYQAIY